MTRIRLEEVAYTAYQVPDLDLMERFLIDFGMMRSARTEDALYMRGTGAAHHIHVSYKGPENKFIGGGWNVGSLDELNKATQIPGASGVEPINGPGGGWRVTLKTPSGHNIWLEYGVASVVELPARRSYRMNVFSEHLRFNSAVRQRAEPTPVLRVGHFVLWVPDAKTEIDWFVKYFELIPSDHLCAPGDPDPIVMGSFLRHDRGQEFVEHHCILISQSKNFGCHHTSFEVLDLDAVVAGHEYLVQNGWTLDAGYGRHYLGSLIYDYWLDPFGNRIEHYTDTDLVNDDYNPVFFVGTADETTQWGMAPPPSFFD
ncbi:VOC family protein [Ancylobacter sp. WKF20]|uniref:VOC family protein n=1 Tax=Ancylobacter sp. WKF20 TaxID=3039801 RepID=UPI0024345580|nr:VOC family protein [Ancylobacter sp. WKF20]WGD29732.1 VOC family protein [Ancylobacter sp. WKF20]